MVRCMVSNIHTALFYGREEDGGNISTIPMVLGCHNNGTCLPPRRKILRKFLGHFIDHGAAGFGRIVVFALLQFTSWLCLPCVRLW